MSRYYVFSRTDDDEDRVRVIALVVDELEIEQKYQGDAVEWATVEEAAEDPQYAEAIALWEAGDDSLHASMRLIAQAEMLAEDAWSESRRSPELVVRTAEAQQLAELFPKHPGVPWLFFHLWDDNGPDAAEAWRVELLSIMEREGYAGALHFAADTAVGIEAGGTQTP